MRRGRLKGPLGSPERPASALGFRLVLAVFGVLVMLVGLVLAFAWNAEAWLVVLLGAGRLVQDRATRRVVVQGG